MQRVLSRVAGALAAPRAAWERFWLSHITPSMAGALPVDALSHEAQPYALPDTSIVFAVPKRKVRVGQDGSDGRGHGMVRSCAPRRD